MIDDEAEAGDGPGATFEADRTRAFVPPPVPGRGRTGPQPAVVVLLALVVVVAVALVKPWPKGIDPVRSAPADALVADPSPATSGDPSATAGAGEVTPSLGPEGIGIDLAFIGTADTHRVWGIAMASIGSADLDDPDGSVTLTPEVRWTAIEPGGSPPGPTLGDPDAIAVAIAVTWPADRQPLGVSVLYRGQSDPGATANGSPVGPLPEHPIRLVPPTAPELAATDPTLRSGAFLLPSTATLNGSSGSMRAGWAPGSYQVIVNRDVGPPTILSFTIAGTAVVTG